MQTFKVLTKTTLIGLTLLTTQGDVTWDRCKKREINGRTNTNTKLAKKKSKQREQRQFHDKNVFEGRNERN